MSRFSVEIYRRGIDVFRQRESIIIVLVGLLSASVSMAQASNNRAASIATPAIGKFMLQDGRTSKWPEPSNGTVVDEPINVIVRMHAANSSAAVGRLMQAMIAAGFGPQGGHTDGYMASIGGRNYAQLPTTGNRLAFADGSLMTTNNHGRFFGPMRWSKDGYYYFVGAFSRETPNYQDLVRFGTSYFHSYISFAQARNQLAENLQSRAGARYLGMIPLKNSFKIGSESTGDHDGTAVLLEL